MRASLDAPYRLASGDRLRVIVFGQDNLTNSFSVDGAGNISMSLIGSVHAQGQTTGQLVQTIEARLRAGYLRDPKVSVEVEAFRPFFVLGEVGASGQYPFVNGMTAQTGVHFPLPCVKGEGGASQKRRQGLGHAELHLRIERRVRPDRR